MLTLQDKPMRKFLKNSFWLFVALCVFLKLGWLAVWLALAFAVVWLIGVGWMDKQAEKKHMQEIQEIAEVLLRVEEEEGIDFSQYGIPCL